jgi:signal transduction histidine kinase
VGLRRADVALGAGAAIAFTALGVVDGGRGAELAATAVVGAALGAARAHPRAAWVLAAVVLLAAAPFGSPSLGLGMAVAAHAFLAGRHERRWGDVAALVVLVAALEAGVGFAADSPVPALVIPSAVWGAGVALRERERVAAQLAERVRELEDEREAHAALSVRYERARIASELHDIVAHALSVMVVQASAGQRLATRDPELTAQAFEAIAGAARQAEEDMGRLVALLSDEEATGPPPDVALVEELVRRAAGSGLDVSLRLEGEREGWPAGHTELAYRVVQEGLTNALRYASGAPVRVLVRGGRDALEVEVRNAAATSPDAALAGAGTGNGLRGLRERVGACGGSMRAGPVGDGGWLLAARLPRRVGAAHPVG